MASLPLRLGVVPFGDITVSLPSEHALRAPPLRHESNNKCRRCHAGPGQKNRSTVVQMVNTCSNRSFLCSQTLLGYSKPDTSSPTRDDTTDYSVSQQWVPPHLRHGLSLLTQACCNCTVVRTIASWTDSGLIILSNRPLSTKQECTCTMQNFFATQTVSHLSILSLSKPCRHR